MQKAGKKAKGKRKKVKKKCIDERETLSYEQEILDNNRQLARLRSRNEELEEETELRKKEFRQLEEDRSDIIAHLKRSLEEKVEESKELSERLSALEELRKDELAIYKKKEEAMEHEYRTMENNLSAEVKLAATISKNCPPFISIQYFIFTAAGKLNALEDWRLARLDLMQKFEKQEKEMADQEMRHKEELYEAEKSVIIGKSMVQKEMKEHLEILSEKLLKAVTLRITEVMNRTIRENVALNRDLDKLMRTNRELDAINNERKKMEQTLRLKCELFETEAMTMLSTTLKQRGAIHQAVEEFQSLITYYGKVKRENTRLHELQQILEDLLEQNNKLRNKEIKLSEKNIIMARNENKQLSELIEKKEKELVALKTILNNASTFINEALQIAEEAYNNQQCIKCTGPKMLSSLMKILQTETITNAVDYTASEIDNIDCKYTMGCLGLIEPVKVTKDNQEEKKESFKEEVKENIKEKVEEEESLKDLEQIPSCLLSDISSSIPSPKE